MPILAQAMSSAFNPFTARSPLTETGFIAIAGAKSGFPQTYRATFIRITRVATGPTRANMAGFGYQATIGAIIPFHYGRWVNDPDDGWMWIPGYVWSPGWVVWRSNDHYTGWMPMPPDEGFLRGNGDHSSFGISINFNRTDDYYGYSRWYGRGYDENRFASNWVFIGTGDLSDRDYRSHAVNQDRQRRQCHQLDD